MMASEKASAPPPYAPQAGYPPDGASFSGTQPYPQGDTFYPPQDQASYPTSAPPAYPVHDPQGASKPYPTQGYPPQGASVGYPPQGGPVGYPPQGVPPGYQPHGAAVGTTTQGYAVAYYPQQTTQHTTTVVTQQPGMQVMVHGRAPPPDNLALSIISFLCCFVVGIFALMKSMRSRELYRLGDFAGAQDMGMQARRIALTAIIVAVCFYVVLVIIRIIFAF